MLAQRQLLAARRVHISAVQPEAAGLEAVIGIDQIVVLAGLEGLLAEEPGTQRLHIGRQLRSAMDGQRRVEDAHFHGAELGLGTDIPVKILHAVNHARGRHLGEVALEVLPVQANGARPESGNANTELRRAESNAVSWPCTKGLDADSAMKCGI
jgi:hypothetical protein